MRAFIIILLFGLLPLCTTLNCYQCAAGTKGCDDPFNSAGPGVSTTGDLSIYTFCMKMKTSGTVVRSGAASCVAVSVNENTLTTCCQTNLCNGACNQYQTPILLALSVFVILIKFK